MSVGRFTCAAALLGVLGLAVGCGSAGDREKGDGLGGGSGPNGSGGTTTLPTTGGSNGSGGGTTLPGTGSTNGSGGGGEPVYCQSATVNFVPQVPTVYVLVDQSGSIYSLNQWVPLRDAVLPVIQTLQSEVRFGFGSYTGTQAACTGLSDMGTIALNNFDAINSYYVNLPVTPSPNQETPTVKAISQVTDILAADTVPGPKAILLVTGDTDNDFCDNGGNDCGSDALIGALQQAYAKGIKTFVFGMGSPQNLEWFDYWAQAGQGELPNWPDALTIDEYNGLIYSHCHGQRAGWDEMWTATGKAAQQPIGDYSTAGGTVKAFVSADTAAVAEGIKEKAESLKSCKLDLSGGETEEGSIEGVKPGAKGDVKVGGELIPTDQWRMNSETELELLGAACEKWLDPNVTDFFAGFACEDLIIIIK